MQFLRDLQIRRKLILVFGVTGVIALSIAVLATIMLNRVSSMTREVDDKWLPGIRTMDAMHSQHSTIRRYVLGYAYCETDECRQKYRAHVADARQKLTDGFNEFISRYATTPEEKAELTHLSALVDLDNRYLDSIMNDLDAGKRDSAIHTILNESKDAYETAYATGDKVVDEYNRGAALETEHALSTASTAKARMSCSAKVRDGAFAPNGPLAAAAQAGSSTA